ncbi:MAG: tetratricopeptide repeat protein [Bacteroidota bacterium]
MSSLILAQNNDIPIPEKPSIAKSYFLKFDSSIVQGDIVHAILYADTASYLYKQYWGKNEEVLANVYRKTALLFSTHYQVNEASIYAEKAIAILKHHLPRNLPLIGDLYVSLGNIAKYRSLNNQAIAYFQKALDAWSLLPSELLSESYLLLHIEIGKIYFELQDYQLAIKYYDKARKFITKQLGNEENYNIAVLYNQIGRTYAETDSLEKALYYLHKASNLTHRLFNMEIEDNAHIFTTISAVHFKNRNYDSALVYAHRAIDVYESLPDDYHEEIKDFKLFKARIYFWTDAFETSAYWYKSYLKEAAKAELSMKDLAHLYLQTGGAFAGKMSMHHALTFYDKGLELYELAKDHDPLTLASLFTSISGIYNDLKYFEKGVLLQKRAVNIYENYDSVTTETIVTAYLNIADMLAASKKYEEEIPWLKKALSKMHKTTNLKATLWNRMAAANYALEKYPEALDYALLETNFYIDIYEGIHVNTASSFLLLGNIYTRIEEQDKAYITFKKALQYDPGIFDQMTQLSLDANRFLSYLYRIKGNHSKADQHALLAMRIQKGMTN